MESALAIIVTGTIIFLAHLFSALFEKTRVPDVLPLVFLGLLLGPIFHIVTPEQIGAVGGVFTTIALVIILFECGLSLQIESLIDSAIPAAKLAFATFLSIGATTTWIGKQFVHLPLVQSLILGSILAATSPPIVIPLIAKMRMSDGAKTIIILDSAICEVLGIVTTLALLQIAKQSTVAPTMMLGGIISSLILAIVIGSISALAWANLLRFIRGVENSIFCTPAFVCIIYGVAEMFGYSGPVASLTFGIWLGNIKRMRSLVPSLAADATGLRSSEESFLAALVFLLKTFFFVFVGISVQFDSMFLFGIGFLLAIWGMLDRLLVSKLVNPIPNNTFDSALVSVMVPKGLAAAVLATLVLGSKIEGAKPIREIAYGVILFSIALTSLMSFLIERGLLTKFYGYFFPMIESAAAELGLPAEAAAKVEKGIQEVTSSLAGVPLAGMTEMTEKTEMTENAEMQSKADDVSSEAGEPASDPGRKTASNRLAGPALDETKRNRTVE